MSFLEGFSCVYFHNDCCRPGPVCRTQRETAQVHKVKWSRGFLIFNSLNSVTLQTLVILPRDAVVFGSTLFAFSLLSKYTFLLSRLYVLRIAPPSLTSSPSFHLKPGVLKLTRCLKADRKYFVCSVSVYWGWVRDEQRPLKKRCQHFTSVMSPARHACHIVINRCEQSSNDLSLKVCWAIMLHLHGSEWCLWQIIPVLIACLFSLRRVLLIGCD